MKRRILITGGLGHIGSKLIRVIPFKIPDSKITIVDNVSTHRYCSLYNLPSDYQYRFVYADVSKDDISEYVKYSDVVVHLAAYVNPSESKVCESNYTRNYCGTRIVGKLCEKYNALLIFPSSTSIYFGKPSFRTDPLYDESYSPRGIYARTKLKEERWIKKFSQRTGLRYVINRFGTICGISPGMRFQTAVNRFCWQAVTGQPITVWKTAYDQLRPYLDIDDAITCIIDEINGLFDERKVYTIATQVTSVRSVLKEIRTYIPSLNIRFVTNRVMVRETYRPPLNTIQTSFQPNGNIRKCVRDTIQILGGVRYVRKTKNKFS